METEDIREQLKDIYYRALLLGLDKVTVDNFTYKVSGDDIILLDYKGSDIYLYVPDWFDGVAKSDTLDSDSTIFEVKEIVLTKRVKIIYEDAFINWNLLCSIKAPGVEIVEKGAFCSSDVLVEVNMESLKRVGENAFAYCICLSLFDCKKIEYLEKRALSTTNLKFISLTNLKEAGSECLSDNSELRKVILPFRKFVAGEGMFRNCVKLNTINTINTDTIKKFMFKSCFQLARLNINASYISASAFDACDSLYQIKLNQRIYKLIPGVLDKLSLRNRSRILTIREFKSFLEKEEKERKTLERVDKLCHTKKR